MKLFQGFAITVLTTGVSTTSDFAGASNGTSIACTVGTKYISVTETITTTAYAAFTTVSTGLGALSKIEITPTFYPSYSTKTFTSYVTVLTKTSPASSINFTSDTSNASGVNSAGSTGGLGYVTSSFTVSPIINTTTIAVVPSPYVVPPATFSPNTATTPIAVLPKPYVTVPIAAIESTKEITETITVCLPSYVSTWPSLLQAESQTSASTTTTSTSTHYVTQYVVEVSASTHGRELSSRYPSSLHNPGNNTASAYTNSSHFISNESNRSTLTSYRNVGSRKASISTITIATNITTTVDTSTSTQHAPDPSTNLSAGTSEGNMTSLDPKADGSSSGDSST